MRNWQLSQPAAKRRHVGAAVDGRAKIEPCGLDSEAADDYFSHDDEKNSCKTLNILRYISLAVEFGAKKKKEKKRGGSGGGGSGTQKIQSSGWIIHNSCVNTSVVVCLWGLISRFGITTFGFAEETAFVISKNL